MECFKWAVITADRWEEIGNNLERVSKLKRFESEYDWTDIEYPFATRHIGKFEKNNKILVNILAVEGERIYILRKSKYDYRNVNLMLITGENSFPDEMWKHIRKHYVAIKSLSRLLTKANTKHNGNQHHCTNCLHGFPRNISKNKHESYCVRNELVRVEMPTCRPWVRTPKANNNSRFHSRCMRISNSY